MKYQVIFRAKTWYLHAWKDHRCYDYIINRAFGSQKILKRNSLVFHWSLKNKQNITWPLGDTKFLFSCWKIFHSFANIFSTLQEKFRISAQPCNILCYLDKTGAINAWTVSNLVQVTSLTLFTICFCFIRWTSPSIQDFSEDWRRIYRLVPQLHITVTPLLRLCFTCPRGCQTLPIPLDSTKRSVVIIIFTRQCLKTFATLLLSSYVVFISMLVWFAKRLTCKQWNGRKQTVQCQLACRVDVFGWASDEYSNPSIYWTCS